MKKGWYALFFSLFSAACVPRYPPPPLLPASVLQIYNPDQAQDWLENNLKYTPDPELHGQKDFWASCALTYHLKAGDCEDYAICAAALLSGDVDKGYIISLGYFDKKGGHAVFAYQYHGRWGIISNIKSEFRRPYFFSLHQAVLDSLRDKYDKYEVFDYSTANIFAGNENLEDKMKLVGKFYLK